ncbi:MAG TPA: glycine cleavage system aminomethyltransferase GcvT [bacterium]|nr:glycine cleavage system aminomethyltransferase GcvT [bacterium]
MKTPLYDVHVQSGASIVDFNGWLMPIQYEGIIAEHNAVRKSVGIFDICHMGVIEVNGPDALRFCQYAITNDAGKLTDGKALYTPLCNKNGGIVDDVLLYRFGKERYAFVVNASNIPKDTAWLKGLLKGFQAEVADASPRTGIIAVQGPNSLPLMEDLYGRAVETLQYYSFVETEICGGPCVLSRTGYTGEMGFELYFPREKAAEIWALIMDKGKRYGIRPIGLGARDTLRLEMGFSLYGHEIDDTTTPLEAGLSWTVCLDKEDFVGKKPLLEQKKSGLPRKLVAFRMLDRSIPRAGNPVRNMGKVIGKVTSGSYSPSLSVGIGMAYVDSLYAVANSQIAVNIRGKDSFAEVVKPPFYHKKAAAKAKK